MSVQMQTIHKATRIDPNDAHILEYSQQMSSDDSDLFVSAVTVYYNILNNVTDPNHDTMDDEAYHRRSQIVLEEMSTLIDTCLNTIDYSIESQDGNMWHSQ